MKAQPERARHLLLYFASILITQGCGLLENGKDPNEIRVVVVSENTAERQLFGY